MKSRNQRYALLALLLLLGLFLVACGGDDEATTPEPTAVAERTSRWPSRRSAGG